MFYVQCIHIAYCRRWWLLLLLCERTDGRTDGTVSFIQSPVCFPYHFRSLAAICVPFFLLLISRIRGSVQNSLELCVRIADSTLLRSCVCIPRVIPIQIEMEGSFACCKFRVLQFLLQVFVRWQICCGSSSFCCSFHISIQLEIPPVPRKFGLAALGRTHTRCNFCFFYFCSACVEDRFNVTLASFVAHTHMHFSIRSSVVKNKSVKVNV